jgi:dienelactone hydrolase
MIGSPLGLTAALAAMLAVSGCGGSDEPAATTQRSEPASPFSYDASRPLDVRDRGRVNRDYPIAVRDVSFLSAGRRVQAYLAVPPRAGRRPAAVFLHGAGGDRQQLLVHAMWLAGRGAVTLALTAPSAAAGADESEGLSPRQALRRQRDLTVADAVAVRRGLDLLSARPDVDPGRLGFLGYSAGARTGALLAGAEPRLDALVLWSGGASPVAEYAAQAPAALRADVRRLLGEVDPLRQIRRARRGVLLLQDGRRDEVVPQAALRALARAAPRGTDVRWYAAGHALNDAAFRDQLDWLERKLALEGAAVRGALTGPKAES